MNHTTLGLIAILAAATLVIGTLAVAPAFAKSIGDGNTLTAQKNKAKALASGTGTTAANVQLNSICFDVPACVGGAVG
jgi:hypothetical protein